MPDDFDRPVYCLAGLPFDAVDMAGALARVRAAVADRRPCFVSTPNLNFLVGCQGDAAFRDSVIHSELSLADGMPIVWMARLLGIPLPERVAGSGLFEDIGRAGGEPVKVYFFGGPDGAAEAACDRVNARGGGLRCTGFASPGFCSVAEMSDEATLAAVNASGADFVVVALGARKGQAWIERNRARLDAPVISHLGAVVNFAAGTVSRAPVWMQRVGLEWLWRIKEEPALWKRYWGDGLALMALLLLQVLPYAIWLRLGRGARGGEPPRVSGRAEGGAWRLEVVGSVPEEVPAFMRQAFREAADSGLDVVADFSGAAHFGPGLLGLLQMLKKRLDASGRALRVTGVSGAGARLFRWNGAGYFLEGWRSGR